MQEGNGMPQTPEDDLQASLERWRAAFASMWDAVMNGDDDDGDSDDEAITGYQAVSDFEWTVTDDVLQHCSIFFEDDGCIVLSFMDGEARDDRECGLDTAIDETVDWLTDYASGRHPDDRADAEAIKTSIVVALRRAADRLEQSTLERNVDAGMSES